MPKLLSERNQSYVGNEKSCGWTPQLGEWFEECGKEGFTVQILQFSERTRNRLLHILWSIFIFLLWLKNLNFKANWLNLRKALILFKINWKFTNLYTTGFNQIHEVQQTNRRANQMLISFALWHIFIPVSCIQMYRLSSICSTMAMAHKYVAGHLEIVTT